MKIGLLTGTGTLLSVNAIKFNGKKNDYYNILHGSGDYGQHMYLLNLEAKDFPAKDQKDTTVITGEMFTLKPIYINNQLAKDRIGNTRYCLAIDKNKTHSNDLILLWEIPNFSYIDVKFRIVKGNCNYIAMGTTGKNREGIIYKSPAPILETSGDFTIEWIGTNIDGELVGCTITYDSEACQFTSVNISKDYDVSNKKFIEVKEF